MPILMHKQRIHCCIIHSVSTDPRTLLNCHLKVGNGNEYPEVHYMPEADLARVYRDILKFVHANNQYQERTLLNIRYHSKVSRQSRLDPRNSIIVSRASGRSSFETRESRIEIRETRSSQICTL